MFNDPQGPIEHFSWAKFIICGVEHSKTKAGRAGAGKDIRLVGNQVSEWVERHGHDLTIEMITGILDQKIEILVIGIGVDGELDCPDSVVREIQDRGIGKVIRLLTPEACKEYNALYHQGRRAALLAHGTC